MELKLPIEWFEKNIEDFPDLWSKYSPYKKMDGLPFTSLKTIGNLSLNDKIKLEVEWARELRRYKGRISAFYKHGNEIFIKVLWDNSGNELSSIVKRFGTIFSIDEVRKIT